MNAQDQGDPAAGASSFTDPPPAKITLADWHERFRQVQDELIGAFRYYRAAGKTSWNAYLQPPSFFSVYGARVLKKLGFDNSLAALRLWGFVLNEAERLWRARQCGAKIVAVMGDYGALAPLSWSFPGVVPFYPDYQYWTPFMCRSNVLLDTASDSGIGENCCFVRAALAAFLRGAYFPKPDLVLAVAGAGCDDLNAVAQRIEATGVPFAWVELPWRRQGRPWYTKLETGVTSTGTVFDSRSRTILLEEFGRVAGMLSELSGARFDENRLAKALALAGRVRSAIRGIRELALRANPAPLPALELMLVEFAGPHFYSDLPECAAVLEHLLATVKARAASGTGPLPQHAVPIAWATPPADPLLLHWMEQMGGRLCATEFMVAQSRTGLVVPGDPMENLVDSFLDGSLLGDTAHRADLICDEAKRNGARGAIVSGIFASSHCVSESRILREELASRIKGPVLAFDVPGPGGKGVRNPVHNRMAAFFETISGNQKK